MAIGYTNTQYYTDIANAIREKTKTTNSMKPNEMAPAILSIKGGGSTEGITDPEELYKLTRPADWLTMPTESEINDDELYLLFHIPDGFSAPISFSVNCTGNYTVRQCSRWTANSYTQVSAISQSSGSTYSAELASKDFGYLTSDGMKQALIKITGTNITSWEVKEYVGKYYKTCSWNIVEITGKLTKLTAFKCYNKNASNDITSNLDRGLGKLKYFSLYGSNQLQSSANMFKYCKSLILVKQLDTSNFTNMSYLFEQCDSLQAIPQFNTSNVTNMSYMFYFAGYTAASFNLNLSNWDTSKVTNMSYMFRNAGYKATSFNLDLSNWNTSNVTDMSWMFDCAGFSAMTFNLNLSNWDTSKVTNMSYMFQDAGHKATSFNLDLLDLSNWNTSKVTKMNSMFSNSCCYGKTFKLDLSSWDTSNVTNMDSMFDSAGYSATSWSVGDISNWNTSKVTDMDYMFNGICSNGVNLKLDLSGWNTSNVKSMSSMFYNCRALKTIYVSELWNTNKVTSSSGMFENCTSLVGGNGTAYSSSNVDKTYARIDKAGTPGYLSEKPYVLKRGPEFNALIPSTTTAIVFTDEVKPSSATAIDLGVEGYNPVVGWLDGTTFKVSTQKAGQKVVFNGESQYMFCGSKYRGNKTTTTQNVTSIDFTNVDTSKVYEMTSMFDNLGYNATSFSLDLSNFDTANVNNMGAMFSSMGFNATTFSLTGLSNWDVSSVYVMEAMFSGTGYKATTFSLDLSGWNVSSVTSMANMFNCAGYNATSWSIGDISNWNVSNVSFFNSMFNGAAHSTPTFSLNLSNWNTQMAMDMNHMFSGAGYSATSWSIGDISNWFIGSIMDFSYMFWNAGYSASTFNLGNLSRWDTMMATNMTSMFNHAGYSAAYTLNLSSWNVSQVTSHADFNWGVESKVTQPTWMM